jgi:Arc/MetJ-type ribon-helix-helix transcriptional regulator
MKTEKAIPKGISLKPGQLEEMGKVIDIDRYGQVSQFIQDAIDEKLQRIQKETEKIAS